MNLHRPAAGALAILLMLPGLAAAYTQDTYDGVWASEHPDHCTCVAASALTWIDSITGSTDTSTTTVRALYGWARPYSQYICNNTSVPNPSYSTTAPYYTRYKYSSSDQGLDPRAFAWILWNNTPAGYGFNDYKYTSQGAGDSELVAGIRITAKPVGAIVAGGAHAFDVTGYQSSSDPELGNYTLDGFYVVDPWYGNGSLTLDGGVYNLHPDYYLSISTWNSNYFKTYSDPYISTIWDGTYVDVLRASTDAQPSDSPPLTYADANWPMVPVQATVASKTTGMDVIQTVTSGLQDNGLTGPSPLGIDFSSVTVGSGLHVEAATSDFPSYWLVPLSSRGSVVATAMVLDGSTGEEFGGVARVGAGYHLPTTASIQHVLGSQGQTWTNVHAIWGWSRESASPFVPLWSGTNASSGATMYADPNGHAVQGIHWDRPQDALE